MCHGKVEIGSKILLRISQEFDVRRLVIRKRQWTGENTLSALDWIVRQQTRIPARFVRSEKSAQERFLPLLDKTHYILIFSTGANRRQ